MPLVLLVALFYRYLLSREAVWIFVGMFLWNYHEVVVADEETVIIPRETLVEADADAAVRLG